MLYMYVCKRVLVLSVCVHNWCVTVMFFGCVFTFCYLHSSKGRVTGERKQPTKPELGGSHAETLVRDRPTSSVQDRFSFSAKPFPFKLCKGSNVYTRPIHIEDIEDTSAQTAGIVSDYTVLRIHQSECTALHQKCIMNKKLEGLACAPDYAE